MAMQQQRRSGKQGQSPPCDSYLATAAADVVRYQRARQLAGTLKQQVVREPIVTVFLRGQDIHLAKTQLPGDGMIDVHIEIQSDGHGAP